jgi:hypothetical protein
LKISKDLEIVVRPVSLNNSESYFIESLENYRKSSNSLLSDYELYLIRNKVQSGIGFFETSRFFPDFILWIIDGKNHIQRIVFIEPHGLGHERYGSEKMILHTKIKEHEKKLENTVPGLTIKLYSYILSPTKFNDLGESLHIKDEYKTSGVYFMEDDEYLEEMFTDVFNS